MAENAEAVENPLDGQLPWDVIGAIEHHIGVLEVPMTNLQEHPAEPICIHVGRRGAKHLASTWQQQTSNTFVWQNDKHLVCTVPCPVETEVQNKAKRAGEARGGRGRAMEDCGGKRDVKEGCGGQRGIEEGCREQHKVEEGRGRA